MIKLGIVMDPIASINIKKDSSFAMLLEAQRRGYELHYMEKIDAPPMPSSGFKMISPCFSQKAFSHCHAGPSGPAVPPFRGVYLRIQ